MKEDNIISALIGLVGACNNNPKTPDTDKLVIKALAFPLSYPAYGEDELRQMIDDIHAEKNAVAPGCAKCATPCGNTDMRRIYEADGAIRNAKLSVLERIQKLAAHALHCQTDDAALCVDSGFFYKSLSYVSYDMEAAALLRLIDEAEKIERDIQSGGTRNGAKDY